MFKFPTPESVPRAKPPFGKAVPLTIPYKGLNAKAAFAVMEPGYALSLVNLFCEPGGIRSRKGYVEWAKTLAGSAAVGSIFPYLPATAAGIKLFASKGGKLYNITAGGVGPWTEEAGVTATGDRWTTQMVQNVAGSFVVAVNEAGGYVLFNGTSWSTVAAGTDPGEINNIDPDNFVYVMEFKERLWFIEKDSTKAWYLPPNQITGNATEFNFGQQFPHGGYLVALVNWTIDAGAGIDDYLVAVSSQGDVVIYEGIDPSDLTTFRKKGVWYVGPLPAGRRQVKATGGDVHILSYFGLVGLSRLVGGSEFTVDPRQHISFVIDPFITNLMKLYGSLDGWQLIDCPREELYLVALPSAAWAVHGNFLAYKTTQETWSTLNNLPFASLVQLNADVFAGTADGRVVKAFVGPLDNVLIGTPSGNPVVCQATPAYENIGGRGTQKRIMLFKPSFLATTAPEVRVTILTNYGPPSVPTIARFPDVEGPIWDAAIWDVSKWAGKQFPFSRWFGVAGKGFAATAQLDFACGGETLLVAEDFWIEEGGIL